MHACGIHSFHHLKDAEEHLAELALQRARGDLHSGHDPLVLGTVAYAGRMLVQANGARSSHAYPADFMLALDGEGEPWTALTGDTLLGLLRWKYCIKTVVAL